ncbi:MAG: type II secretion system protein [Verrucomicrobia bacterium]|nr:type II secretion system protein [Verrucomicrobiota bacterium]
MGHDNPRQRAAAGGEARAPAGGPASRQPRGQAGSAAPAPGGRRAGAFTLIELMVVVGIISIVMTISIPSIYRRLHPESMQKAVSDLMEACSHARANAILNGQPTDLVIRADDNSISVQPAGGAGRTRAVDGPDVVQHRNRGVDYAEFRKPQDPGTGASGGGGIFSARFSETIGVELAEINFMNIMDLDEARVRFFPNGTCYEFRMVLFQPKTGERRLVQTEVTTGLLEVQSDVHKFLK